MSSRALKGHGLHWLRKSREIMPNRGRAALQRRVSRLESRRALAPVLRKRACNDFSAACYSRALSNLAVVKNEGTSRKEARSRAPLRLLDPEFGEQLRAFQLRICGASAESTPATLHSALSSASAAIRGRAG